MAIRPVVLVYQDLATPTVTPTAPDLNCLVVGPAFHIQDYYKPGSTGYGDKADIRLASDYGTLEGDPATPAPANPTAITVAEPPNNAIGAQLDGDSVLVYFDEARVSISEGATGTTSSAAPNTFTASGTTWNTAGAQKVNPGDRLTVKDAGGNRFTRTVLSVASDTSLSLTADIPSAGFTPGSGQTFRITRLLTDQLIDASFQTTTGNIVKIAGGVTLPVTGQGNKTVVYAKVYMAYRSLRQDLPEVDTVEKIADIESKIGRIDARNPLAVGTFVALQNTTSVIQFAAVATDTLVGHAAVRDKLSSRPDIYAIIPLTVDVSIFAMWNADCTGLALPDEDEGRPQRFRVVIGSGTLPVVKTLIQPSSTGESLAASGTAPTDITRVTLTGTSSLISAGVVPGDILRVTVTSNGPTGIALGDYPIASVVSASILEVGTATPFNGAATLDVTCTIVQADGTTVRLASAALTGVVTVVGDDLYLILKDPSGTFVSAGVSAGDLIQIPINPNATITPNGAVTSLIVESVLSDQRVRVVNAGQDQPTAMNELPHGVRRTGGGLVTTTAINYRIVRTLTKDQQVTELVAVAQSFRSKRTILVWPNKCDVAGVIGGTSQPGFYLACAVGGMTAGLPSQQGFTNLGIAGISQIYNSNTYFTEGQLTDLSNGGWYVFAQQTPTSLPYTVHQLTTDPATLESGEFSVVKNFDFVSLFFVDILEDFLGQYNVNQDTLTLIQGALSTGGDLLKLRTIAKIGAPLTSFAITEIGISPVSGDRVLIYLAVGLPKPLNAIELHLVG